MNSYTSLKFGSPPWENLEREQYQGFCSLIPDLAVASKSAPPKEGRSFALELGLVRLVRQADRRTVLTVRKKRQPADSAGCL
ncbi:hypothetical protein GPEL0_01r2927 [Geoanaerobacter pelophilus]|uniref:Uncharacterized protein n=1 Tax=Geoanaerobacter pelophilus TaxID=60036 RepID=A0ABQ0MM10_9BACT|nr:hypothetical protein GPEL0_01r2927 [Geoanaerobacter pelophilus]